MNSNREHITDGSPCWCGPNFIKTEGSDVVVHRQLPPCLDCDTAANKSEGLLKRNKVLTDTIGVLESELDKRAGLFGRIKKQRDEFRAIALHFRQVIDEQHYYETDCSGCKDNMINAEMALDVEIPGSVA